jgi:NAD dependent epimerase/dehydratase family enzyme
VSWIQLDDLVRLLLFAIDREQIKGIYNAVSPGPVPNREFTRQLARALGRWAHLPAPAWALRLALGEMAGMLLGSQRVSADRLLAEGFAFRYPGLAEALAHSV